MCAYERVRPPILGDHLYAPKEAQDLVPHLQLHAAISSFYHPVTGEPMQFEAPALFPTLITD